MAHIEAEQTSISGYSRIQSLLQLLPPQTAQLPWKKGRVTVSQALWIAKGKLPFSGSTAGVFCSTIPSVLSSVRTNTTLCYLYSKFLMAVLPHRSLLQSVPRWSSYDEETILTSASWAGFSASFVPMVCTRAAHGAVRTHTREMPTRVMPYHWFIGATPTLHLTRHGYQRCTLTHATIC